MFDHFFSIAAAATGVHIGLIEELMYVVKESTTETKIVLVILGLASIWAWSVIITKLLQFSRAKKLNDAFQEEFKKNRSTLHIFRNISKDVVSDCPFFNVYYDACDEIQARLKPVAVRTEGIARNSVPPSVVTTNYQFQQTSPQIPQAQEILPQSSASANAGAKQVLSLKSMEHVRRVIESSVAEESVKLEDNLVLLALAVSGSPFVGLFGTVWGVMSTFSYVGMRGSADLATMAPGVAGALIATVAGLFVAIPSMCFYNMLVHRLRILTVKLDNFAQELLSRMETEFVDDDE